MKDVGEVNQFLLKRVMCGLSYDVNFSHFWFIHMFSRKIPMQLHILPFALGNNPDNKLMALPP
jgi:hypothetical protein